MERRRSIDEFRHAPVSQWAPQFPSGRLDAIYLHWSGFDYESVFESYHVCVAMRVGGEIAIVETNDLRANMRDVYAQPDLPYAAHTFRRNSFAAGVAIMGMHDARPDDFGSYPLTPPLVDALCLVAARIAHRYGIAVDAEHVLTHAEAALADGYFGTDPIEDRWDIARLVPSASPLTENDAIVTGEELRGKIRAFSRS
jgi:hypothetical protein